MTHRIWARLFAGVSFGLFAAAAGAAPILSDNFNDGNDDGWTHFDPNAVMLDGIPGQFTSYDASGNAYRIQSFSSGFRTSPSRAWAYRADHAYTDFHITTDLVGFNANLDQRLGIVARLGDFQPGTVDGYMLSYNPSPGVAAGGRLQIYRITDELPTAIGVGADVSPALLGTGVYKLELTGTDDEFVGRLLSSAGDALFTVSATDATYAGGYTGLLVTNRTDGSADATFDNFVVSAPEPGSLALVGLALAFNAMRRRRKQH